MEGPKTPFEKVVERVGGIPQLVQMLHEDGYHIDPSTVYRWGYPKERGGRGGLIPWGAVSRIRRAARAAGIYLPPEIFVPEEELT